MTESHPRHARILDQIRDLAHCLTQLGEWEEALPHLEEGLELAELRDEAHLYAAKLDFLAARTYAKLDRPRRALERAAAAEEHLEGETGARERALAAEVAAWREARVLSPEPPRPRTGPPKPR